MPDIDHLLELLRRWPHAVWIGLAIGLAIGLTSLLRVRRKPRQPAPSPSLQSPGTATPPPPTSPPRTPAPVATPSLAALLDLEGDIDADKHYGLVGLETLYAYILRLHDIHALPNTQVKLGPDYLHFTAAHPNDFAIVRIVDNAYHLTVSGRHYYDAVYADAASLIWNEVYGSGRPSQRLTAEQRQSARLDLERRIDADSADGLPDMAHIAAYVARLNLLGHDIRVSLHGAMLGFYPGGLASFDISMIDNGYLIVTRAKDTDEHRTVADAQQLVWNVLAGRQRPSFGTHP